jgi:hypothetical protein
MCVDYAGHDPYMIYITYSLAIATKQCWLYPLNNVKRIEERNGLYFRYIKMASYNIVK